MIIVRVELHSSVDGEVTEIARMKICNNGDEPNPEVGNYTVQTIRGRGTIKLDKWKQQRIGTVTGHARLRVHVWSLVLKALVAMNYTTATPDALKSNENNLAE